MHVLFIYLFIIIGSSIRRRMEVKAPECITQVCLAGYLDIF